MELKLELEHLTKRYGENTALDDVTITLTPGTYGLLGANGAGKSTLMNLITDNVKRDGGKICFNGEDILSLGDKFRSQLGYMPQQQGVYERKIEKRAAVWGKSAGRCQSGGKLLSV